MFAQITAARRLKASYAFSSSRRSVARSCSSAKRCQTCAISSRLARRSAGRLCALSKHSREPPILLCSRRHDRSRCRKDFAYYLQQLRIAGRFSCRILAARHCLPSSQKVGALPRKSLRDRVSLRAKLRLSGTAGTSVVLRPSLFRACAGPLGLIRVPGTF
jgi:hypothetical protein